MKFTYTWKGVVHTVNLRDKVKHFLFPETANLERRVTVAEYRYKRMRKAKHLLVISDKDLSKKNISFDGLDLYAEFNNTSLRDCVINSVVRDGFDRNAIIAWGGDKGIFQGCAFFGVNESIVVNKKKRKK